MFCFIIYLYYNALSYAGFFFAIYNWIKATSKAMLLFPSAVLNDGHTCLSNNTASTAVWQMMWYILGHYSLLFKTLLFKSVWEIPNSQTGTLFSLSKALSVFYVLKCYQWIASWGKTSVLITRTSSRLFLNWLYYIFEKVFFFIKERIQWLFILWPSSLALTPL